MTLPPAEEKPARPPLRETDALGTLIKDLKSLTASLGAKAAANEKKNGIKRVLPVRSLGVVLEAWQTERAAGPPTLISTPFPGVTSRLGGGMAPGELIYLGARPGSGKTAWALELGRWAAQRGTSVLMISREMRAENLGRRLVAREGQIRSWALRADALTGFEEARVDDAVRLLSGLPFWISDTAFSLEGIDQVCADPDVPPFGLILIDYLQLLKPPNGIKERRHQIEAISKGLKALALARRCPVVCLSSLARAQDQKQAPTLASLRESGELEHDADTVIFLHKPDSNLDLRYCIVEKNREGRLGRVPLDFSGDFQQFTEIEEGSDGTGTERHQGAARGRTHGRLPGGNRDDT